MRSAAASGARIAVLYTSVFEAIKDVKEEIREDMDLAINARSVAEALRSAGHAAWTGLVCAVIWRERERHRRGIFSAPVLGAWIVAIVLHTLWDVFGTLDPKNPALAGVFLIGLVVITITSVTLLIRRYLESRRILVGRPLNLPPL